MFWMTYALVESTALMMLVQQSGVIEAVCCGRDARTRLGAIEEEVKHQA